MLLFHRDLGGAGRPPLVLVHGFLGSSRNWQTAGAGLTDRFHVLALDLRNHGRSPHAPEMTYAAMLADVRRYDRGVLKAEDTQGADLSGEDPTAWVKLLKDRLKGRY